MLLITVYKIQRNILWRRIETEGLAVLVPIQKMQNLEISYSYSQIISNIAIIFACKKLKHLHLPSKIFNSNLSFYLWQMPAEEVDCIN